MIRSTAITLSSLAGLLFCVSACQQVSVSKDVRAVPLDPQKTIAKKGAPPRAAQYGPPVILGVLSYKEISESSGIVSSHTTPGLYWTHNDSGDGPFLYAFDSKGAHKGVWRVTGATARDWEDLAVGPGPERGRNYLYIGDIGDNRVARAEVRVYRVPEPVITPADASSTKANPISTKEVEIIRLRYPDGGHDAEALLVHPVNGNIYIVTKIPFGNPIIYEAQAPLNIAEATTMARLGELSLPDFFGGLITGGDISPDGSRLALCDYSRGYELVLPLAGAPFNEIWKQPLTAIDLGERKQGEAIGYRLDGRALLATSEGRRSPLIQVVRR
ncbi:MAG TPA: hypothetical protein VGW76_02940 [Pyrinomonadaceae bacterium]|nr:hypothetical protein [Pyrinomonadaceae bacterium]